MTLSTTGQVGTSMLILLRNWTRQTFEVSREFSFGFKWTHNVSSMHNSSLCCHSYSTCLAREYITDNWQNVVYWKFSHLNACFFILLEPWLAIWPIKCLCICTITWLGKNGQPTSIIHCLRIIGALPCREGGTASLSDAQSHFRAGKK